MRGLCYTALLVPVTLVPGFFFPYVTTRAVLFRACVALGLSLLLLKAQLWRMVWEPEWDWTFVSLLSFIFALALSAAFGVSPWRSFYGDYERMGGVWAWLHLGGFYLLLRASMTDERYWHRCLTGAVVIGTAVSIFAFAERFQVTLGIAWWIGESGSAITTIGNPGIAGAYLVFVFSFSLYLAMRAGSIRARLSYLAAAVVIFAALLFTRNRSSVLGIMAGSTLAVAVYLATTRTTRAVGVAGANRRLRRRAALGLLIACGVGATALLATARYAGDSRFVTRLPLTIQRVVRTAPGGGDASRLIQWEASWRGFLARPLLGYGPENYHVVWGEQLDPGIYRRDPDSRWDRAHNAFLEVLATSGIVGGAALLLMIGAVVSRLVVAHRKGAMTPEEIALFAGLFSAYGFYLVFWFFDLSSVMLMVAAMAYVSSRVSGGAIVSTGERTTVSLRSKVILGAGALALLGTLYVHGYETLRVAGLLSRITAGGRSENAGLRDFQEIFQSPAPLSYHTLLIYSQHLRTLSPQFDAIRADPRRQAGLDTSLRQSFEILEREIRRDPRNERIALHKARIAMLAAQYYREPRFFSAAIETLRGAVAVSPKRIQTRHVLANAYLYAREPALALAQLDTALRIFPSYSATHVYLAFAYRTSGNLDASRKWLHSALDLGGTTPPRVFLEVASELSRRGDPSAAAELLRRYLWVKYGPAWLWPPTLLRQVPPEDLRAFALFASLQRTSPEAETAGASTMPAIRRMCPLLVPLAKRQTFDVCGVKPSLTAPDFRTARFQGGGITVREPLPDARP